VRASDLVMKKRAREVLQHALTSQLGDLDTLAAEVAAGKRELQTALDAARLARDQADAAAR